MFDAIAPFTPDLRDVLTTLGRWAVDTDRDAAVRTNTRKDFGGLVQNDEQLIEALCGIDPLI